jgi:hypothetical protein
MVPFLAPEKVCGLIPIRRFFDLSSVTGAALRACALRRTRLARMRGKKRRSRFSTQKASVRWHAST